MRRICRHCHKGYLKRTGQHFTWRSYLGCPKGTVYCRACQHCGRQATHRILGPIPTGLSRQHPGG